MVRRCGTCGVFIDSRNGQGIPCSGACKSWHHVACASSPISSEEIQEILISNISWLCAACSPSADESGREALDLSMSAVFARMDRLEGRVTALYEDNARLRAELAQYQSIRVELKSLEYRLDAMTFWSASPRPYGAEAPRPSGVNRFESTTLRDLDLSGAPFSSALVGGIGGPLSAAGGVQGKPATDSGSLRRDVLTRALNSGSRIAIPSGTLGSPLPGVQAPHLSNIGLEIPATDVNLPVPQTVAQTGDGPRATEVPGTSSTFVIPEVAKSKGKKNDHRPLSALNKGLTLRKRRESDSSRDSGDSEDRQKPQRSNRGKRRPLRVGKAKPTSAAASLLNAAPRYRNLFVTRLPPSLTPDQLADYVEETLSTHRRPNCVKVSRADNPSATYSSYRIEFTEDEFVEANSDGFWLEHIRYREFFFGGTRRGTVERQVKPLEEPVGSGALRMNLT